MRNLLAFLFVLLMGTGMLAQNKTIVFGYEDIPQSLLVNPAADMPQDFHAGLPGLSQVYLHGGSSGVSAFDIFQESSVDINQRITEAIAGMSFRDFFTVNQQLEILSAGWRNKKGDYWSAGLYQELDVLAYFPEDLADLAWEGNRNYIGRSFDLGQLSVTSEVLMVYHVGISRQFNKNLRVGARAKLYSNIAHASSTGNQGTFVTTETPGTVNIYEHIVTNADLELRTSGIDAISEAGSPGREVAKRAMLGGNLGVGVDLGISYDWNRNWTFDASILDLGFVYHSNDVKRYTARGDYVLNGIEFIFPPLSDGQRTVDYYRRLTDDLDEAFPRDTLTTAYLQMRPTKVNAAISYGFGTFGEGEDCNCLNKESTRWRERLGLQFFSVIRPRRPHMALSAFYYRRLTGFLSAKVAYTVDEYSASNLGAGFAADIGPVNFYFTVDNILRYGNVARAKNVSLQLGLNLKLSSE
ncbi:DUF5723 family protein [Gilvibacter sp.]|uniref:DUF5723 family protein n=1 Tax=Gilvibacter sp. TaxID=2729997 RepID=UPI0025C27307|nr:DUF5723 family protein [Gilvibacter sp.]NQX76780.1 hypothetical protein [Gilvibacter sp.]